MMNSNKIKCACCNFITLDENSISEICPVCYWQKDFYQESNIDDNNGPNLISLRMAKENFQKNGVVEERFKDYVRRPFDQEKE
jgi:hypothetical protein